MESVGAPRLRGPDVAGNPGSHFDCLLVDGGFRCRERLVLRGDERVDQAGEGQQEHQHGRDVDHGGGLGGLGAELAEPVRGEQQAAQGLALEDGLTLGGHVGRAASAGRPGWRRWPSALRRPGPAAALWGAPSSA